MATPAAQQKTVKKRPEAIAAESRYYVRLTINKARRTSLAMLVGGAVLMFGYIINKQSQEGAGWILVGAPLALISLGFLLFPETENWEYEPWQAKPEQYEKHIIG